MMGLTPRQLELLDFLRAHMKAHGVPPSFREMAVHLGNRSKSNVQRLLAALVEKGYVRHMPKRARGIELLKTEDSHAPDCSCAGCARARYMERLKLVQAISNQAPAVIARARLTNIRILSAAARFHLLGDLQRQAAPRTRTAVPREAS